MSDAKRRLTKEERDALAQRASDIIAATNYYMADGGRGLTERDDYILAGGVQRLLDDIDAADIERDEIVASLHYNIDESVALRGKCDEQAKEIERLRNVDIESIDEVIAEMTDAARIDEPISVDVVHMWAKQIGAALGRGHA